MNTLIIYYSKTGFTKRYATWLSEMGDYKLLTYKEAQQTTLSSYDCIIFASWFHAGSIKKLDWFKQNCNFCKHKIVLATGASPSDSPEITAAMEKNFPNDGSDYQTFYLRSGLAPEKMGFGDKLMIQMFRKMMAKKSDKTAYEIELTEALSSSFDYCSKEYLAPVIDYLHTLN